MALFPVDKLYRNLGQRVINETSKMEGRREGRKGERKKEK